MIELYTFGSLGLALIALFLFYKWEPGSTKWWVSGSISVALALTSMYIATSNDHQSVKCVQIHS